MVYGREYDDKTLRFEPSGGLINGSLVMQDRETDTYWSIMSGSAVGGELKNTKLAELPLGEKMQWKDWLKKHPETLVLSVDGKEDRPVDYYADYFSNERGYRNLEAKDKRLKTKEPIFAFEYDGRKVAVPHEEFKNGRVFDFEGKKLFLFRPRDAEIFVSTAAFLTDDGAIEKRNGKWVDTKSECVFDESSGKFSGTGNACPQLLTGFDTFWYNWSLINTDTDVLKK